MYLPHPRAHIPRSRWPILALTRQAAEFVPRSHAACRSSVQLSLPAIPFVDRDVASFFASPRSVCRDGRRPRWYGICDKDSPQTLLGNACCETRRLQSVISPVSYCSFFFLAAEL
jgi:hypothetical protein